MAANNAVREKRPGTDRLRAVPNLVLSFTTGHCRSARITDPIVHECANLYYRGSIEVNGIEPISIRDFAQD
jgi:hypothetical protein